MVIGNSLRQSPYQYVAKRDDKTGIWTILDTWHNALVNLNEEDDIPEGSPAVLKITEGAFLVLIQEATRIGMLQKAIDSQTVPVSEFEELKMKYEDSLQRKQAEPSSLESDVGKGHSEQFELANKKLDVLLKLANVGNLDAEISQKILSLGGNAEVNG